MERMHRRALALLLLLAVCCGLLAACGGKAEPAELPDGVYSVDVKTDSSMFHINEACHGKGTLTVQDGKMTVHISLPSKSITTLFAGVKADAVKEGAALIQPTVDTVTYDDGMTDEVYGFDVPVPHLDEPFAVAIIGTHGNWYDHQVTVSNPESIASPEG